MVRAVTDAILLSVASPRFLASPLCSSQEGYTRVWLLCEVKVSRAIPRWITDYAAKRAMPRATQWLKPAVEAAAQLWLKDDEGGDES